MSWQLKIERQTEQITSLTDEIKQDLRQIEHAPRPNLHPAVAAGIVDFLETAEAVGVAAEAYENPDGDGVGYQVDVPLGHVYEEAQPNFVLSP
ncbi:MAG: hypothetical protein QG607_240 [Patescibacteria group bacterium]|nr:hypothetical protein [Patescibacteria group bacterium]